MTLMDLHLTNVVANNRGWGDLTLTLPEVPNLQEGQWCHALPRRLSALERAHLAGRDYPPTSAWEVHDRGTARKTMRRERDVL
jgi:hypothetical protein